MEQTKFSFTRKTITIASLSAILITSLILALVSFAIRRLPDDKNDNSDMSTIMNNSVETSKNHIENSSIENVNENANVSDVFAESTLSSDNSVENSTNESNVDEEISHGWIINEYGYTYVYNGCGFEQFNFKTSALERYINSFDNLVNVLPEQTRIFNITVPVSSTFASIPREIYTNDNFYNQSQSAFVSTVASKNNKKIIDIPIVSLLQEHYDNDEYLFFKTDKNWTSLAAYYAYRAFCENAEFDSYSLENYVKRDMGDYLGSFYHATKLSSMYESPDSLVCYSTLPTVKTSLTVYDGELVYSDYALCNNKVSLYSGYNVFLGRSAARYEINTTSKGGSVLIIGDTSAHPIVPFLATHYSKIDIIDPRKFDKPLNEFLSEREYDDCITMCYSTNAISGEYIPAFNNFIGDNNNE